MKLPTINTKSSVFTSSLVFFLIVLSISIFISRNSWFHSKNIATAFQTSTGGNWNSSITWGTPDPSTPPVLISHYKMNDATSTTDVIDSVGATGTAATNTANISTAGKINNALHFNGTNDSISFPDTGFSTGSAEFTVSAWVKTTFSLSGYEAIFSYGTSAGSEKFFFLILGTGNVFISTFGPSMSSAGALVNDGNWHFIAVTQFGGTYNIYIDNVLRSSGFMDTHFALFGTAHIGKGSDGAQDYNGEIDDFRFYDRVLTTSDISSIYNSGIGTEDEPVFATSSLAEGVNYPGPSDDASITTEVVTLTQDQNVHSINLSGGMLDLAGYTLNVYGNWTNSGGTLIDSSASSSGIVNFVGTTTQRIIGETTFSSLIKISSTTSSLLFDSSATTTVTNNLTLSGTSGNLLTISSNAGSVAPIFDSEWFGASSSPFSGAFGIAHDSSNNIYVSDFSTGDIQEFASDGTFIRFFNTNGDGALTNPGQVALDLAGNLYVIDHSESDLDGRIVKFSADGNYATSTDLIPNLVGGIAVSASGDAIYVNDYNQEILRLNANFNVVASTTDAGGPFGFQYGSLELDPTGNFLYAADDTNNRVVKLNSSNLSFIISSNGPAEAPFGGPQGVAFDSSGNIYVANVNNATVIKLNPDFSFLTQFGGLGGAYMLTIDSSNNIYVADNGYGTVKKFTQSSSEFFNIIHLGSTSTENFSYLNVSASINGSDHEFDCTHGCMNSGGNSGWVFPIAVIARRPRINRNITSTENITGVGGDNSGISISTSSENIPVTEIPASSVPETRPAQYFFNNNLKFGDLSPEVKLLQEFLNNHGFVLAKTGFGSPGNETSYFGALTFKSVVRLQEANFEAILKPLELKGGTGNFFKYTRAYVNSVLKSETR